MVARLIVAGALSVLEDQHLDATEQQLRTLFLCILFTAIRFTGSDYGCRMLRIGVMWQRKISAG